ncbi:MAG: hypothetical protein H7Z13_09825 [Ferruginibacter sp.]|nr:hypothetical protein [Ferruginibacter sp.]
MKKLLVFAVIAVTFASCANSETKTEEVKSSDSTTVVTPVAPDSTLVVTDSTIKTTVTTDSIKK